MLRKRVIPIVLIDGFSVLKTIQFNERRGLGSPVTVVRTYNTRNVDELIVLDIDATRQNRSIDIFTVKDIAEDCFMPLTVGGGITNLDHIRTLLKNGADKISINSEALERPDFIKEASDVFGAQCIVVSIDVVKRKGKYLIYKDDKEYHDKELLDWCNQAADLRAGEILINMVDLDGTFEGGDFELAESVANSVNIPVIYTGGISSPEDCARVAMSKVSAVGAASIFHFTDATPNDCKRAMAAKDIPVRIEED